MNIDEYLYFVRRAFDGMLDALELLGDEHANEAPPLAGANPPWAIAYHCTEVVDYWIGHLIAGRPSRRNRAAEFTASGSVADLRGRVTALQSRLVDDLAGFDQTAPLLNSPPSAYEGPARELSPCGVLLHVLEELAQHHGQIELSRDALLALAGDRR